MGFVFGCNFNHGRTTHVQPVTGGDALVTCLRSLTLVYALFRSTAWTAGGSIFWHYPAQTANPGLFIPINLETKLWEVRADIETHHVREEYKGSSFSWLSSLTWAEMLGTNSEMCFPFLFEHPRPDLQ
jgi:hypothetical protein